MLGTAGIGKSALLRHAREVAEGFATLSAAGVEVEAELPFSALSDLLEPLRPRIGELPDAQAAALRGALRLSADPVPDRFAVYAGVRTLLSDAARKRPLLLLVDDAQWIDAASREALLFYARRIEDDAAVLLFGVREGEGAELREDWLELIEVEGLTEQESAELAHLCAPQIARPVAEALHRESGGNPLAIVELAETRSDAQLEGRRPLPTPLPAGPRLQKVFERRTERLPEATRDALLVAAAAQSGRMDLIAGGLEAHGLGVDALGPAEEQGLVVIEGAPCHGATHSLGRRSTTPPRRRTGGRRTPHSRARRATIRPTPVRGTVRLRRALARTVDEPRILSPAPRTPQPRQLKSA